jgi:acetyltransferase-like isoleucine patch superfamily enzyme
MLLSIYNFLRYIQNSTFTLFIRKGFAEFGHRSKIELPSRLHGICRIEVGEFVFIGSDSWLSTLPETKPEKGPIIEIGDRTSISGHVTISGTKKIVIEHDVLIARYVYISDHSHDYSDKDEPIITQGISKIRPVRIKSGAWLGQSVVVCPGVTIGRNSVIGANSVVTQDIPDYCVAAGSPAKVIRKAQ